MKRDLPNRCVEIPVAEGVLPDFIVLDIDSTLAIGWLSIGPSDDEREDVAVVCADAVLAANGRPPTSFRIGLLRDVVEQLLDEADVLRELFARSDDDAQGGDAEV